jgi:DNA-directed RNA polymerase alpha subunit
VRIMKKDFSKCIFCGALPHKRGCWVEKLNLKLPKYIPCVDYPNSSVNLLNLSKRAVHTLEQIEIKTIGQLINAYPILILRPKNSGQKTLFEIVKKLNDRNGVILKNKSYETAFTIINLIYMCINNYSLLKKIKEEIEEEIEKQRGLIP